LYERAIQARKELLGPCHIHTLDSVEGLAECLGGQGRYKEAESLFDDVIQKREEILGEFHPQTLE